MPDVKISALPSATTPLAGTEVLPIVQGGATDQVSVANLTAGRTVAAAGLTVDANSATPAVRITQTGAGNALLVEDSTNPDATPFVIDASGNVITGRTTNTNLFAPPTINFQIVGSQAVNRAAAGPQQNFYRVNTSFDSPSIVSASDRLGYIGFAGYDGSNQLLAAAIEALVDGTPGTNDMPGRLAFLTTADGASNPTERMRITNDGRITAGAGVGAGSSATQFTIGGTLVSASNVTRAFSNIGTAPTTSTTEVSSFVSAPSTADGIASVTAVNGFVASQGTITGGTRTAPTAQYGFSASSTLVGATNNYGFYGNIPAGTGRYNFYANGTAQNLFSGDVLIFGAGAIGYATGSGGAVTQATSRTTGVTLNKTNGAITLVSAAGTTAYQSFTVTNSTVAATDVIRVCQKSGTDKYIIAVTNVSAGSFEITFATTGGTTTEQPVFNFSVTKAVTS